jgi:hypothetical protein
MDLTRIKYGNTFSLLSKGSINLLGLVKNSTFPINSLLKALTPIKNHLLERQVASDEIAGFMNDVPILFEGFVEGLVNEQMEKLENHLSLTANERDRVLDLFRTIASQEHNGLTATVANGQSFALEIVDKVLDSGEKILICSAGEYTDITKAFLYETKEGLIRLNPILTPLNWEADILSEDSIADLSILEILKEIASRLEPDEDHDDLSVKALLLKIGTYCRIKDNEYISMVDYVSKMVESLIGFVPVDASLKELLMLLSRGLIAEYALSSIRSRKVHIITYFKDMLVSSSIQQVLIEGVDAIRGGFDAIATFIGSVDSWIRNAAASVQHVFQVLVKAFQQGGIVGMASAIIQLYSSPTNSVVSEDGLLQFTDNEKLMPREYIAGLLTVVVTVVSAIASIIASIFSPIVGAITAAVGYVVHGIIKSFTMDWNGTFCQAEINVTKEIVDNFPVGLYQTEIPFEESGLSDDEIDQLSVMFSGANYVVVPGGILLIGASQEERIFRFEFHPGLHHTRFDLLFQDKMVDYEILIAPDGPSYLHGFLMKGRHYPVPNINILDTLNYLEIDSLIIDGEGYYKGVSDSYLSIAYSANIAAFLLFINFVAVHGDNTDAYKVPLEGYVGSMGVGTWRDGRSNESFLEFSDNIYAVFYSPLADVLLRRDSPFPLYYDSFRKFTSWNEAVQFAIDSELVNANGCRIFNFTNMHIGYEDWVNATRKDELGYYHFEHPELVDYPFSTFMVSVSNINAIIQHRMWAGGVADVTSNMLWAVKMPKWNRATFISWILLAGLVTTVAVATVAIVARRVRKAIQMSRANSARKVEAAWRSYVSAESPAEAKAAYQAYRKTVRTANFKAKFLGGTRYDASGYWNGDPSESQEGAGGETTEKVSGLQRLLGHSNEQDYAELLLANAVHTSTLLSYIDRVDLSVPNDEIIGKASASLDVYSRSLKIKR